MQTITVEALKAKLDAGEKINLVDVREPHEHEAFNIGGILLPLGQVQSLQIDDIEDLKEEIRINITSINQIRTLQRNISPISDVRSAINLFILLKIL